MSLSYTFKSLAAFLFVLFWGWELSAVPSYPRPIRVEQPDGTTMTVRLYGDERFNYVTTVDGYNLVAENGVLYYAQVQGTKLVSTGVQAHDPMNRTNEERRILSSVSFGYPHGVAAAAMVADAGSGVAFGASPVLEDDLHLRTTAAGTNTGEEFRSLVILVSFSDRDFSISNPRDAFDRMLNEEGYSENNAMGSARDYYVDNSNGKFNPHFDVVGPFQLSQSVFYYPGNEGQSIIPAIVILRSFATSASFISAIIIPFFNGYPNVIRTARRGCALTELREDAPKALPRSLIIPVITAGVTGQPPP